METQNSKGWAWAAVLVVLVVAVGLWLWWGSRSATAPGTSEIAGPALGADDATTAIEEELNATDLGNVEAELQSTETDLQSL